MEELKGMRAYLSGPIDDVADDGIVWRKDLRKGCIDKSIEMIFLDPCDKPDYLGQEVGVEKRRMENLKAGGKREWKIAQKEVKNFKRIDYRMVDMCDLFILYIDVDAHMCGSYFETKVAEEQRKPIFVILSSNMERKYFPTWLIDLVDYDHIFANVDDCLDYLEKVNNEEVALDDRWIKVD
tara:strand:- start:1320 stop:1862 length:543 start_codon:yes stop_codon:yes gene_type:complete